MRYYNFNCAFLVEDLIWTIILSDGGVHIVSNKDLSFKYVAIFGVFQVDSSTGWPHRHQIMNAVSRISVKTYRNYQKLPVGQKR